MIYDHDDYDCRVTDDLELIDGAVKTFRGCMIFFVLVLLFIAGVIAFKYWH